MTETKSKKKNQDSIHQNMSFEEQSKNILETLEKENKSNNQKTKDSLDPEQLPTHITSQMKRHNLRGMHKSVDY